MSTAARTLQGCPQKAARTPPTEGQLRKGNKANGGYKNERENHQAD
nr:MAG TPA: hypothetical protein [Caudoviricetes sp.]DAN86093.1 MAG TPA: hypothetical protein [Caudoviricetes sp.]DAY38116.1 MAG TPA: hypothetical protein [Caudoviricetes sp.]DAZ06085.1 MAG TPA: hypothetical protein [Caudoviricetes sp.]DAZ08564.1 MAG TPA: hypothetical protein [Caudoviricetes sp.]